MTIRQFNELSLNGLNGRRGTACARRRNCIDQRDDEGARWDVFGCFETGTSDQRMLPDALCQLVVQKHFPNPIFETFGAPLHDSCDQIICLRRDQAQQEINKYQPNGDIENR
jgi:hypothetical protein